MENILDIYIHMILNNNNNNNNNIFTEYASTIISDNYH